MCLRVSTLVTASSPDKLGSFQITSLDKRRAYFTFPLRQMTDTKVSVVQQNPLLFMLWQQQHLTALPAGTKTTSPKVLNWLDKCFSWTFWNRIVKLSIHEHFARPTGAVARTLRTHPCAFTALHELNVREIVFGGIKCETATSRTQMQQTHFLVCCISAPRPSGEQSEARG